MKTKINILFLIFFAAGMRCGGQIITTVAGNGTAGFSGDGGPATAASFYPHDVDVDAVGNIYITDRTNHRIRKIDTAGIISTIAGTGSPGFMGDDGAATGAELSSPNSIVLDVAGNMYISDGLNSAIRKISTSGIITTIAGKGYSGFGGDGGPATDALLNDPFGVDVDKAGNIYIADMYNNRIRKINAAGIISTIAGTATAGYSGDGSPATAAQMDLPSCLNLDGSGNIYISDYNNNRIRKISTSGIITTVAGSGPAGAGAGIFGGDGGPATTAFLNNPFAVLVNNCGDIFISDETNNRIRKVDKYGTISTIAGTGTGGYLGDGVPATTAEISSPAGLTTDRNGNLLIADFFNHYIRKVNNVTAVPSFTEGASTSIVVCENDTASLNALLTVSDLSTDEPDTWKLFSSPAHGAAAAAYTMLSAGGAITPAGLTYIPTKGFSGKDSFKVVVAECAGTDTITIYATVTPVAMCHAGVSNVAAGASGLNIYPNPSYSGSFSINVSTEHEEQVTLIFSNLVGERVKQITAPANTAVTVQLDVPRGIYFLNANTTDMQWNGKVIIR